jgi:hypothetical protein
MLCLGVLCTVWPNHISFAKSFPNSCPEPLIWFLNILNYYRVGLSAPHPTPNLEDQASVFITLGGRVDQAPDTHLSRLLRHMRYAGAILISRPPHGKSDAHSNFKIGYQLLK